MKEYELPSIWGFISVPITFGLFLLAAEIGQGLGWFVSVLS